MGYIYRQYLQLGILLTQSMYSAQRKRNGFFFGNTYNGNCDDDNKT